MEARATGQESHVLAHPSEQDIRDRLHAMVANDLLGPAGGEREELVDEYPSSRYLIGLLAPHGRWVDQSELEQLAIAGEERTEEGEPEPDAPPIRTLVPSAIGLTFDVRADCDRLSVTAAWGHYERTESEEVTGEDGQPKMVWRRVPRRGTVEVELESGTLEAQSPVGDQPEVVIRGQARRGEDHWLVSLFLVNNQEEPNRLRDEAWLFQPELSVTSSDGQPAFVRRTEAGGRDDEPEMRRLRMLHRHSVEFASGHGVAVRAHVEPSDPLRATRLTTAVMPSYDVPQTEAPSPEEIPELAEVVLDQRRLAEIGDEELAGVFEPLVRAYERWTDEQESRIDDPQAHLGEFSADARGAIEDCREAGRRMREGIELLRSEADAREAFRFANRAMWLQRVHYLAAERRRRGDDRRLEEVVAEVDIPESRSWRSFQLAFILLNLAPIVDPTHEDRELIDLLWFPTGGGKTEAYLGAAAFTLAMRRLRSSLGGLDAGDGVAVIMRYTLRLLTIQQFQRATALICACEHIRHQDPDRWGSKPFRIGLWIGNKATPGRTAHAESALASMRGSGGFSGAHGTPVQLSNCPWCGSALVDGRGHPLSYEVRMDIPSKGLGRTFAYCNSKYGRCPFSKRQSPDEGIPVVVVDEEIYRLTPSIIVGTVDKFAQLPWRGPTQTLFGRVAGRCTLHGYRSPDLFDSDTHPKSQRLPDGGKTVPAGPLRPPDLVIQDELHLIAGPLGSMVGLYEAAVDRLCTWQLDGKGIRPKVIASTATVRRADRQGYALFNRRLKVFPPPGIDAGDSFFARQCDTEAVPGRRYIGICAHGRRFKSALIRVYVAFMGAAEELFQRYGQVVDPYMTLVGYFNSLRDLGGMRRGVEDDVTNRLKLLNRRGWHRRPRPRVEELTSRLASAAIPRILDQLFVSFKEGRPKDSPRPIDVLLATNMISVGVDVQRLGAMVVAGQPKATAEYIQATSRVGRRAPGIVFTVYGWSRPRDLSHYESFEHYHATFNQYVEALTVTPFTPRAIDRGLTALMVSFMRQAELEWNAEEKAQVAETHTERAKQVVADIRARAEAIAADTGFGDLIERELWARFDDWKRQQSEEGKTIRYSFYGPSHSVELMHKPSDEDWDLWTIPTSMREVEAGVSLIGVSSDLGESSGPSYDFPAARAGDD